MRKEYKGYNKQYLNNAIEIKTDMSFFQRMWNVIANPFRYVFKGKIIW